MALSYEQWLQQIFPTTPQAQAWEGQFIPAAAQEMYGQYLNQQSGAAPMWVQQQSGDVTQLVDKATGLPSQTFQNPGDAYTAQRAQEQQSAIDALPGQRYTDADYNNPNSAFWQNRYSPDTPWQQVVSENYSRHLIESLAHANYFDRFKNFDDNARQQLYGNILPDLQRFESDNQHQSDRSVLRMAAAVLGGVAGSYLGGADSGAEAATAGGGEVGSGYAASAPGATEGGLSGYTQLAEGGNTTTDVPLVGDGAAGTGTTDYTGGLNTSVQGDQGLNAGSFNSANLGAGGGEATTGGLTTPSSLSGAGSLSPGSFSGESLYPVIGGGTAAAANGLSTGSGVSNGSGTSSDLMRLIGAIAPAALGAYASHEQSQSLQDLANRYMEFGAPSRARYEASYAPGFSMNMDPGYTDALNNATKSFLHKASINGNPADSPNAWDQTLTDINSKFAYPALQDFRKMNANAGGIANFQTAAPGIDTAAINAGRGVYDAIGAGAADIFNPPRTLTDVLRDLRRAGYA